MMDSLNQTAIALPARLLSDSGTITSVQTAIMLALLSITVVSALLVACFFRQMPTSLSKRTSALGLLGAVLLYCYLADRTTVFSKLGKSTEETTFTYLCLLALMSGAVTIYPSSPFSPMIERSQSDRAFDLLPRQQTEEWKGWMQIIILLYHYFGMSRVLHVYRLIRILVGSYLFLTGYGHTIYFLRTNDFSAHRVVSVLTRLNLLASILPFVMGSKYDLYYFPALSTFWFLVTWAVVPRTSSRALPWLAVVMRILFAMLSIEALLRMPVIWYTCAHIISIAKGVDLDAREFLFRLSLDRFVPYVGILVACANECLQHSSQPLVWLPRFRKTAMVAGSILLLAAYFLFLPRFDSKEQSNRYHPVTEAAPILAFVMLRNSHLILRKHYSRLFSWVGRHSLETFVLQYHIWLAGDAKKLLSTFWCGTEAGPTVTGAKCWIERFLITALFLFASYLTSWSISILNSWLLCLNKSTNSDGSVLPSSGAIKRANSGTRSMGGRILQMDCRQRFILVLLFLWMLNVIW